MVKKKSLKEFAGTKHTNKVQILGTKSLYRYFKF